MNVFDLHRAIGPVQTSVSMERAQTLMGLGSEELQTLVARKKLALVPTPDGCRIQRASLISLMADGLMKEQPPAEGAAPLYVLIVDDDLVARTLYTQVAQRALPGCAVLSAANGSHALNLLNQVIPDVVITDLSMPTDGFRLAWWLHVSPHHAGVLTAVTTGLSAAQIQAAGGLPPFVKLLPKSGGPQPLMRWLQAVAAVADVGDDDA